MQRAHKALNEMHIKNARLIAFIWVAMFFVAFVSLTLAQK